MNRNTLYNLAAAATISLLSACTSNDGTVSISGTVANGNGETLALLHLTGNNPVLIDTLTLSGNGSFKFKPTVEKGGPDFFCLVLNGQTIPVISDTLQTPIVVTADKEKFATAYTVADELNSNLQKAVAIGGDMRRSILNLTQSVRAGELPQMEYQAKLQNVISAYKENVLQSYIYQDPASPISYYLLFETVSGLKIFNPYDLKDNRAYGAVANLWLNTYPNSPRTEFLAQSTREGMAFRIQQKRESERADSIVQNAINDAAPFLDLKLKGLNDETVALSDVAGKGKVTLLDFTAFYITEVAVPHNEVLSKLYKKYADQGISIYQVCLDPNVNFWKVSSSNLPWTVVHDEDLLFDENGMIAYSTAASVYNVTNIPTTFVLKRDGSVVTRVEDDSKIDAAVANAF